LETLCPNLKSSFLWEKGFGDDTSNPHTLDGHAMNFDLANLKDRIEGGVISVIHLNSFFQVRKLITIK